MSISALVRKFLKRIQKSGTGYSMQGSAGFYGLDAAKNGLNTKAEDPSTEAYRWNIRAEGDAIRAYNAANANRYLQYNTGSGQFRCYTGGQQDVQFYRLDGEASGGGDEPPQPVQPTVTTGGATSVTQTEATLAATYTGTPTYGGFLWGLSADHLEEDWQASYLDGSSFRVSLNGLGAGHTYYYKAYIAVMEGSVYKYYYGEIKSFTTTAGEIIIGGDHAQG